MAAQSGHQSVRSVLDTSGPFPCGAPRSVSAGRIIDLPSDAARRAAGEGGDQRAGLSGDAAYSGSAGTGPSSRCQPEPDPVSHGTAGRIQWAYDSGSPRARNGRPWRRSPRPRRSGRGSDGAGLFGCTTSHDRGAASAAALPLLPGSPGIPESLRCHRGLPGRGARLASTGPTQPDSSSAGDADRDGAAGILPRHWLGGDAGWRHAAGRRALRSSSTRCRVPDGGTTRRCGSLSGRLWPRLVGWAYSRRPRARRAGADGAGAGLAPTAQHPASERTYNTWRPVPG
jgi:hypothetical protein